MRILEETEKAVKVLNGQIIKTGYNHVTEMDYEYKKDNYLWIPKSLCKIENGEVIDVAHWFARREMIIEFLTLVEKEDGRKFYE